MLSALTDGQRDKQTNKQTDRTDFIPSTADAGGNNLHINLAENSLIESSDHVDSWWKNTWGNMSALVVQRSWSQRVVAEIFSKSKLRIPDSYGAKTTENQTPLSHFA